MTPAGDDDPLAYAFDADHGRDPHELAALLGGKGAGLARMSSMGLPVPPGFTLTTAACRAYLSDGWTDAHERAVAAGVAQIEAATGKRLGDASSPLLVSVRSGAEASMPGMMDTVVDVGMTDEVAAALARRYEARSFAADTQRRALLSHAAVVVDPGDDCLRVAASIDDIDELRHHLAEHGVTLPTSPLEQVNCAVRAVFDSWSTRRAVHYREAQGLDDTLGTAATVQTMVFGNVGSRSGTGVAFSRDPRTGRRGLMGDFLAGAQGDDVVAGNHETLPLDTLRERWPEVWTELDDVAHRLEHSFADMVDLEFTVEDGQLWLLQVRRAHRSALAELRAAIDMAEDPTFPVDRSEAVRRCRRLLEEPPTLISAASTGEEVVVVAGHPAAPGRAVGILCLDVDRAVELEAQGADVVLVRRETSPADVHGMGASVGFVTTLGGPVSHAAVVARSWGLPAVVGASELSILDAAVEAGGVRVEEGEVVTVDGDTGRLLLGAHGGDRTPAVEVDVIRRWAAEADE